MTLTCARCRRAIGKPIMVDGRGYGPRCADLVVIGDLLTQPKPQTARRRARRANERQLALEVFP